MHGDIIKYLGGENMIRVTKLRKQHWRHDVYSYTSVPRPDYGLLLVTHGEIVITTENDNITAKTGDVIFLPKYLHYEAIVEKEADDCLVNFDVVGQGLAFTRPYKLLENAPLYCTDRFMKLVKEPINERCHNLRLRGLFYLLVDSIATAASEENMLKDSNMDNAKNMLEDEQDHKITDIAKECRMSESSLRKNFKAYYGISPAEYRLRYRLDRAKYLLESTNMTLCEISNALHFYDTAYFCRMFKAYTGMTPRAYAKTKSL